MPQIDVTNLREKAGRLLALARTARGNGDDDIAAGLLKRAAVYEEAIKAAEKAE